jgi:hypothetical protein
MAALGVILFVLCLLFFDGFAAQGLQQRREAWKTQG